MKRLAVIPLLATTILLSSCSSGATSSADTTSSTRTTTTASAAASAAPLLPLAFTEDTSATATALISAAQGGAITANGSDGSTYVLTVPANALVADTEISVVPLKDVAGIPSDQPIAATLLQPDGLQFLTPATLTISPANPIPQEHQVMFQATQTGTEISLAMVDPTSKSMVMDVPHFSIGGAASVTDAVFRELSVEAADGALAHADSVLARSAGEGRRAALLGIEDSGTLGPEVDAAANDAVEALAQAVAELGGDCAATEHVTKQVLGLERQRQLLGMPDDPRLDDMLKQLEAQSVAAFASCQEKAITECKKKPDPGILLQFWFGYLRQQALLGIAANELPDGGEASQERADQLCSPAYSISGALGSTPETSFTGCMSKLGEPFSVTGSGGNIVSLEFSPSSEKAGRWRWDGQVGNAPMDEQGKGKYTISIADDGSGGSLTGNGAVVTDRIIDKFTQQVNFNLTLTPAKGC
jgi:hypothetical protein